MPLLWKRHEHPDPYLDRPRYTCDEYEFEITKEGDGNWWLRLSGNPVGFGPRLSDAKRRAAMLVSGEQSF